MPRAHIYILAFLCAPRTRSRASYPTAGLIISYDWIHRYMLDTQLGSVYACTCITHRTVPALLLSHTRPVGPIVPNQWRAICSRTTRWIMHAPGWLREYMGHDSLKAYVCILYASPCSPLLVLWPGEVEGTSLAMAQGKASPVPAPEPMFRVSPVLRRYDADVPPTAVGACCRRRLGPQFRFPMRFFAADALSTSTHGALSE